MGTELTREYLAHIYGIAGLLPGVIGLSLAWKVETPWSEYLLMASGWIAALVYAIILMRVASISNHYAERCGQSELETIKIEERLVSLKRDFDSEVQMLKEKLVERQLQHDSEMARRAATLDYLAGIAMSKQPHPRARQRKGNQDDD